MAKDRWNSTLNLSFIAAAYLAVIAWFSKGKKPAEGEGQHK